MKTLVTATICCNNFEKFLTNDSVSLSLSAILAAILTYRKREKVREKESVTPSISVRKSFSKTRVNTSLKIK